MSDEMCWQEMLGEIREIRVQVAVMSERIAAVADHETRIRAVERRVWAIPSLAGILGIAALVLQLAGR